MPVEGTLVVLNALSVASTALMVRRPSQFQRSVVSGGTVVKPHGWRNREEKKYLRISEGKKLQKQSQPSAISTRLGVVDMKAGWPPKLSQPAASDWGPKAS